MSTQPSPIQGITLTGENGTYLFSPKGKESPLKEKGKVSRVFRGKEVGQEKAVVVKQLHPKFARKPAAVQHFLSEQNKTIVHPNVPQVLDVVQQEGQVFVIREFVEGKVADEWLNGLRLSGSDRILQSVQLALKVGAILEIAHQQGIIHGDIRPANIMVEDGIPFGEGAGPKVYLIDWGQAFDFGSKNEASLTKKAFSMIYSPPEQVLSKWDLVGPTTDFYALALSLFEWITKEPAYYHDHPAKLINIQLAMPLPTHRKMPKTLQDVLLKATQKPVFPKPPNLLPEKVLTKYLATANAKRFPDWDSFSEALEGFLATLEKPKPFWQFWR